MAFAAQDGTAYLWLERNLIVLAAVIAHDLKPLGSVLAVCSLFRTALRAALRRHHISLVESLLFFFREEKGLFALNANCFNVRHCGSPSGCLVR